MKEKDPDTFYSLRTAGKYANVEGQAMYKAIKMGQLKAEKVEIFYRNGSKREVWAIRKEDIDEYRKTKYLREKRIVDGEKLFDISQDKWSVLHASKVLHSMLGIPYPPCHIYYLIRTGQLQAYKKAGAWIIRQQDLTDLYEKKFELLEKYRQIKN